MIKCSSNVKITICSSESKSLIFAFNMFRILISNNTILPMFKMKPHFNIKNHTEKGTQMSI